MSTRPSHVAFLSLSCRRLRETKAPETPHPESFAFVVREAKPRGRKTGKAKGKANTLLCFITYIYQYVIYKSKAFIVYGVLPLCLPYQKQNPPTLPTHQNHVLHGRNFACVLPAVFDAAQVVTFYGFDRPVVGILQLLSKSPCG